MVLKKISSKLKERSKKDTVQHIVALDIGTEFVKALIGQIDGDDILVTGVGRQHQDLSAMHSGAIADISAVVSNCEKALTEAEKQAGISPRSCVIGLAGELVKGTTTTVRYKRPDSAQELTLEEMEVIIKKVQDRAYEQAKKTLAWEVGSKDVEIKLVNSAIVAIQIDGYKVSNPIGFQGKDVSIQLFTAFAPLIHIGALERTAKELDLDLLAVAAEPFAVARSVIGTDATSSLSAVLIDVGGGTTDIAVVDDGGVEGTRMFGIGGRSFTRTIASELDLDFEAAEKLKLRLNNKSLEDDKQKQVSSAIDKTLKVWQSGVELALGEFSRVEHLPNKFLLCGGGASLDQLIDGLHTQKWYKELPFTKRPSVQLIEPAQVVGIADETGKLTDHTFITAMGLLRVAHDTIDVTGDANSSVKEKLNKLLSI